MKDFKYKKNDRLLLLSGEKYAIISECVKRKHISYYVLKSIINIEDFLSPNIDKDLLERITKKDINTERKEKIKRLIK